jgi:rhodanese-related sulfurtransferase
MIGANRKVLALGIAVVLLAGMIGGTIARGAYRSYAGWPDPTNPNVTLDDVEATVARRLPVPELTDGELVAKLALGNVVVFDVREADEFAKSHLAGAHRIDPDMSAEAFRERFGAELKGRSVVFYCAVGVRSGYMLARVQPVLAASHAVEAHNLRGGIFRWRTAGRPLIAETMSRPSADAPVHPYDARWGLLLDRTLKSRPSQSMMEPR